MSNTGHKGISASRDGRGHVKSFGIFVQWKKKTLRTTVYGDDLDEALIRRAEFERELGKPPTEIKIKAGEGIRRDPRGSRGHGPVWRAYVKVHGKQRSAQFSIRKYGEKGAKAKAEAWRAREFLWLLQQGSRLRPRSKASR